MTIDHSNATLSYRHDFNPELCKIQVVPDRGEVPDFEPGQYAEIALVESETSRENHIEPIVRRKVERRAFSICSPPMERRYFEFYVSLIPGGHLTPKVWEMNINDRLWLGPKVKGKFTLSHALDLQNLGEKDFLFIATGTGLAPYVSMLRHYYLNQDNSFKKQRPWRRCVVIHGVRHENDLGYREELEAMVKKHPDTFYVPIISRAPGHSRWEGLRGRVQKVFEDNLLEATLGIPLHPQETQAFLCGNPEMIDSMEVLLQRRGFTLHHKKNPGNIHFERYW